MSQYSNDDNFFSKDYGPILTDMDRKILEDKLTKKVVDIPKPLLEELKELKYKYADSYFYNFNESMIIRVGTKMVLEGLSNIVISMIHDEDSLVNSLWALFNIDRSVKSENQGQSLYSRNVKSIMSSGGKDYSSFCIRKSVTMPYSLFSKVKSTKFNFEKETGSYWIKDNSFFKIGLMLMLDVLQSIDIRAVKAEEDLENMVREVINIP